MKLARRYQLIGRLAVAFIIATMLLTTISPTIFSPDAQAQDGEGDDSPPASVTIVGNFQTQLGCDEDWQPACEQTQLTYDAEDDLWTGSFDLTAGEYEYKAALNGSWDEAYGLNADGTQGSPNIPLVLEEDTTVAFFYSDATNWVTDDVNSLIATVAGDFQEEIGCPGDWQPDCLRSWLQDPDGDGIYTLETLAPTGDWEGKVAVNQGWDLSYGAEGDDTPGSANIPFSVSEGENLVTFSFDSETKLLDIQTSAGDFAAPETAAPEGDTDEEPAAGPAAQTPQPDSVTIAGSFQAELGCPDDWRPECEITMLTYDEEDDLWTGTFDLPAGEWEYKGALNGSWDLSYGVNADGTPGSPNIPLVLEEDTTVTFFYSHTTNWVTDNVNSLIANLAGDFQEEIGCPGDWQPDCLRTWLQDPDGDGIYHYGTTLIPAGSWEVKVPVNQSWDLSYGVDGNDAAGSPNIPFTVPEEGSYVEFFFDSETKLLRITSDGEVPTPTTVTPNEARAYWVNERQIVWDIPNRVGAEYRLYYSPTAELEFGAEGITGGEYITLTRDPGGMREDSAEKFPHLTEMEMVLRIPDEEVAKIPEILKSQIGIMATDYTGAITGATGLQIPGVLDDLYTYSGELGVIWDGDTPTLRVWAPTAQNVRLHLFADADPATESTVYDMELNPEFGIWSTTGDPGWEWQYYLYEVQVYAPSTQQIETNLVTDPYSLSLAMNSTRSQIVDLSDPALMPEGWEDLAKPELERFEDVVLYELHIRDFSVNDPTVPEEYQGTYMAFTVDASNGMTHLRNLAEAGLTHLHLLPSFDIATIDENKANWEGPTFEELSQYPSDSEEQQALIDAVRDQDGFNWGYDPYHYTVPEGSYSTDPDGPQRIIEYREMVMSLNQNGIRVVMDVVYNHTNSAGQAEKSVLDRIVPGYYHRLNERGGVSTSTCCQNTATEHNMMRKLMVDSVITWSTAYKVDGYRFDLMGHHMLTDMLEVREALNSLTLEQDGIDGSKIYVYGEGWNFGEVADNARGVNATQLNIAGTGIGAFNDRLRDAVRGGNPFGGWQEQGFATGLYYDPNAITPGTEEEQLQRLLLFADQIRIGLAGNLEDYTFESASGEIVNGTEIPYNNSPAAYTQDPQENIVYISAHDNETWFDAIQYKMPQDATVEERVRAHNVGVSIVSLSQGVPFFHAGIDMLRSKSLDRNSYNSGDWFNRLDFSYEFNNWAVGLPPAGDNEANWDIMRPLLAQEGITPEQADILQAVDHLQEMLQIRKSSPLFRLETAEAVQESLAFHNTGPDQIPGVIVMSLTDSMEIDPNYSMIVVVFNATDEAVDFTEDTVAGVPMELHPVQVSSSDPVVQTASYDAASGTFSVPARTTAVFVAPQQ